MHQTQAKSGAIIRLTPERWEHISQNHPEMAGYLHDVLATISSPEEVRKGSAGELMATRGVADGKVLIAVYRESDATTGFVITAFLTRRLRWIEKRERIWP